MKKIIVLTAVIVMACFQKLVAQKDEPGRLVVKSFNAAFKDAENITWAHMQSIWQVRFTKNEEYRLAYFGSAGELLVSGTRISYEVAPLSIKESVEKLQSSMAAPEEVLLIQTIYELNESGTTRYFLNLDSNKQFVSVMLSDKGRSQVLKRIMKEAEPVNQLAVIHQ